LKEYIRYLDVNREPIIAHVISMDNGGKPVEVALIYNTSYTENIFFQTTILIRMKEERTCKVLEQV
jgi:DNA gyrase/topoisomerase IV subunit B